MKKRLICVLISVAVLALGACSNRTQESAEGRKTSGMFLPMNIGIVQANEGLYVSGVNSGFLYYVDLETEKSTILCNKPNCSHPKSTECNGFLPGVGRTLFWYENYLYRANPLDGELILYRIYPDGSGYDKYAVLGQSDTQSLKAGCMSDGTFYYATSAPIKSANIKRETETFDIYRIDIDKQGEPEKITGVEAKNPAFISMIGGEDGAWIQLQWRENSTEKIADIYYLQNGEKELTKKLDGIKEAKMTGPSVSKDAIYYTSEGSIWRYSQGNKKGIAQVDKEDENIRNPIVYDNWIFEDSGNKIVVYKQDGTYVNTVEYETVGKTSMEQQTTCYLAGVNHKGLYIDLYSSEKESLYFCPLEDALTKETVEWEILLPSL